MNEKYFAKKVEAKWQKKWAETGAFTATHSEQPKFYAASICVVWHDSYGGLRINGKCQVVDMDGNPIPSLYAGCEASGGDNQHGLGRGVVHAYIAGTNANEEPALAAVL